MAQHDMNIANQSFPSFRTDLNNALTAINSMQSGTSRPSGAVAGTMWLDTTSASSPTIKFFDGSDDISFATIDYSANTVNFLDSTVTADLVNDTTPQLGGDLDLNSSDITGTGNVNITGTVTATSFSGSGIVGGATGVDFNDNVKARFGTGNDLEIYHDGSNSYIDDAVTGRLYIRGNDRVQIQKYTGEDMIIANADGSVNLYYDNAKKLETESTGVAVTGAFTATGDVTAFHTSDKNLKQNIKNIENPLDKVNQLNGVYYNWTEEAQEKNNHLGKEKEIGVIAQDVEKVLPEIVTTREDGTKAIRYERLCSVLIEAVKELQKKVDSLSNKGE